MVHSTHDSVRVRVVIRTAKSIAMLSQVLASTQHHSGWKHLVQLQWELLRNFEFYKTLLNRYETLRNSIETLRNSIETLRDSTTLY
jgi:uncharacterized protein YlxW (UPF0749 family)